MKPGWKTTEFWTTLVAQGLALLAFVGLLSPVDSQTLGEALGKIAGAVATLVANAAIVIHYVRSRLLLKLGDKPKSLPPSLPMAFLVIVGSVLVASPAEAAPRKSAGAMLPWRSRIEQHLRDLQRPAPPSPPIYVLPPQQPLPIQGEPRQQMPIQGEPRQPLPIQGEPRQTPPLQGPPQQPLPIPGPPLQPMPYMPPADSGPHSYSVRRALGRASE